jgi:hypothetical protein
MLVPRRAGWETGFAGFAGLAEFAGSAGSAGFAGFDWFDGFDGLEVERRRTPFVWWASATGRSGPAQHSARRRIVLHKECVECVEEELVDLGGGSL